MPRAGRHALLILAALVIQPARGVSDHGLDLVLLVVSLIGLRMPMLQAALWGLASGFVQDLCSVSWVGPHLIGNAAAAMMSSWLKNRIYRERIATQGLLVSGAALLQQLLIWVLLVWDGTAPSRVDAGALLTQTFLATSLAGFAASFLLVRFGRRYRDPATA